MCLVQIVCVYDVFFPFQNCAVCVYDVSCPIRCVLEGRQLSSDKSVFASLLEVGVDLITLIGFLHIVLYQVSPTSPYLNCASAVSARFLF